VSTKKEKNEKIKKYMSMFDIEIKQIELPGSLKCIRNFKVSRLKCPNSFFQPCAI
jgi:ERCC4-related helicase